MIVVGIAVAGGLFYVLKQPSRKTEEPVKPVSGNDGNALRLQAYERLTLLVDRISIPNIISRTGHEGLTAREMQFVLTKNIRDEFEYNITQQIYVTAEVWNAVKNLKEKNLLTINQIASTLPAGASGLDLNRALLEFLVHDQQANLPELVSQALSFEAKKLM
jgi:hypothetical protein